MMFQRRLRKNTVAYSLRAIEGGSRHEVAVDDDVDEGASDVDRRQEREHRADEQRERESLHRAGAEPVEDERADDRRHVRIEDRPKGPSEADADRSPRRAAPPQLLFDALEYKYVGVDRHTDR